ncbi:hypothetical protein ACFWYW_38095 [Nonomuraea sp. NPDC059023]
MPPILVGKDEPPEPLFTDGLTGKLRLLGTLVAGVVVPSYRATA